MQVERPNATAFANAQHAAARCIDALHSALSTLLASTLAGPAEAYQSLEARIAYVQPPQVSIEGSGAQGSTRVDVFARAMHHSTEPVYIGSTTATVGGTAQAPTCSLSALTAVTVAGAPPRWVGGVMSAANDSGGAW